MDTTLKELLTENFLKWQIAQKETKTQREFAEECLDIHKVTFSRIYNGKQPATKSMLVRFAEKTGDPRFYDIAGVPSVDPLLSYVSRSWGDLSEAQQHKIKEDIETYLKGDDEEETLAELPA
ncbi:MAG: hypothetical protein HN390_01440 [Anaerolineae bacterium]|nr:hypothetical protein [Anaerolineae bacterium]MBT7192117.1 hypothetical protein [Anaerolineae bacterium]